MKKYYDLAKEYLSQYIKIDTSKPIDNMDYIIDFWKQIYEGEGIRYEIYEAPNGFKSICGFVIDGIANESVVLLNHADVVPANPDEWIYPPFSGEVHEDCIYGRGAIDMKGLAIIQLITCLCIKRECKNPKKNICILSVPDEETGGFYGAKYVTENYLGRLNPAVVLDEGTFGVRYKGNITFYISYSQKKTLWLKLQAYGKNGHGACPASDNANNILIKALAKLCETPYLDVPEEKCGITQKRNDFKEENGLERLISHNTITVTSILSGSAPNVKPKYAEAVLDCRLMPETEVDAFLCKLREKIDDDRIGIEILKRTDKVHCSSTNHKIISYIKEAVKKNIPAAQVKTIVTPVGTDSKYFRNVGIESYGFFPIVMDSDELCMMHGINEKISLSNLRIAIDVYMHVLHHYIEGEEQND